MDEKQETKCYFYSNNSSLKILNCKEKKKDG